MGAVGRQGGEVGSMVGGGEGEDRGVWFEMVELGRE